MKKMIFLEIIGGMMLFLSVPVLAAIISVPADYSTIQEGIDAANSGDTVQVAAGDYAGAITLKEGIILQGSGAEVTIIDGGGNRHTVTGANNSEICGFTIKNSGPSGYAGVYIDGSMIISNNIVCNNGRGISCRHSTSTITYNSIYNNGDDGIWDDFGSQSQIKNNIFYGCSPAITCANGSSSIIENNTMKDNNVGVDIDINCSPIIINNIIVNNGHVGICASTTTVFPDISYNDVWNHTFSNYRNCSPNTGNISQDPLFVNAANHNYHLQTGSPCIDAGNPDAQYNDPDGSRNDMGVYGGEENIKDIFPPEVTNYNPARNATEVSIDANIIVSVRDMGMAGVNIDSLVMTVEGITVVPSISGTMAEYVLTYNPPVDFNYGQEINVTIDACDLADPVNVMTQRTYSFIIEQAKIPFADELSQVKAYPNPYKGNFSSGITFNFLTEGSKIKIYTLSGQLVKEIEVSDEGMVLWDIKNEDGKKIASGIYLYLIGDEKGNKKSGKIAIVK